MRKPSFSRPRALRTMCALTPREHRRVAHMLWRAERTAGAASPLTVLWSELTAADALAIRSALVAEHLRAGARLVGAMPHDTMGLDNGATDDDATGIAWVTSDMLLSSETTDLPPLAQPMATARLAFEFSEAGVSRTRPCLEIVDSPYRVAPVTAVDRLAANWGRSLLRVGAPVESRGVDAHAPDGRMIADEAVVRTFPIRETALRTALPAFTSAVMSSGDGTLPALLLSGALCEPVELGGHRHICTDLAGFGRVALDVGVTTGKAAGSA